jgi:hypothetical protein
MVNASESAARPRSVPHTARTRRRGTVRPEREDDEPPCRAVAVVAGEGEGAEREVAPARGVEAAIMRCAGLGPGAGVRLEEEDELALELEARCSVGHVEPQRRGHRELLERQRVRDPRSRRLPAARHRHAAQRVREAVRVGARHAVLALLACRVRTPDRHD